MANYGWIQYGLPFFNDAINLDPGKPELKIEYRRLNIC